VSGDASQLPLDDDAGTTVPHSARIWNYWLGGRLNYPVDRAAGEAYQQAYPQIVDVALAARAFQTRAVRFLAGQAGLTQFLDVGAGLPAVANTHEIAQGIEPSARILYVDHDPFVVKHGRAQLTSAAAGSAEFIEGDLYQPAAILTAAARTLDLTQPVALLLMGVMGHMTEADAYPIVGQLVAGLPAGSYLALQDGTSSGTEAFDQAQDEYDDTGALPYHLRRPEQVAAFFSGLDLVEPGVVPLQRWRPDPGQPGPADLPNVGGVGRKA
jgi:O-methyltransferase involved in polyketide biosynthesis